MLSKNGRIILIVIISMVLLACQAGNSKSPMTTAEPAGTPIPMETLVSTDTPKPTRTPVPTRTPNLAATQEYEDFFSKIQSYYDEGYLPSLNGTLIEMISFNEEWAQIDWRYYWLYYPYSLEAGTFVMDGHFIWESASDTPNPSGCGFIFDTSDRDDRPYSVILDQANVVVIDKLNHIIGTTRGTGSVTFALPAEADFTLVVNNQIKRIIVFVDGEFVGEYSIPLSEEIDGTIGATILSGTNKDYGTRCKIEDAKFWLVE